MPALQSNVDAESQGVTYRNRRLLDLAHEAPCFVDWPHACTGFNGCEPMHSDNSIFGRGMSHKSHDFAIASGCRNGHAALTAHVGADIEREAKFMCWLRAHAKFMAWCWENGKLKVAA